MNIKQFVSDIGHWRYTEIPEAQIGIIRIAMAIALDEENKQYEQNNGTFKYLIQT